MWKKVISCLIWITFGIFAIVFIRSLYFRFGQPWVTGYEFRHSLQKEIADATQITVVEHSNKWDEIPRQLEQGVKEPSLPHNWKETVYATVVINKTQITQLKDTFAPALDYSKSRFLACMFEPHHRIEFMRLDGSKYIVEICFVCGQIAIAHEHERIFPEGWGPRLSTFISSLGLHPNGTWDKG